jgi:isoleucyl-tRNA synthetase
MSQHRKTILSATIDIIKEEINVKEISLVSDDDTSVVVKKAKPNFKSIGPKFGKLVKQISEKIKTLNASEIVSLEKGNEIEFEIAGEKVNISLSDTEILHEDIPGWLVESDEDLTIALDTTLTEELINEGLAREFVNRVQNYRKDSKFEITDRIEITVKANKKLESAIKSLEDYSKTETLAKNIIFISTIDGASTQFEIEGEIADVIITKI